MRIMLWLTLTSLVWAVPGGRGGHCRYSGHRYSSGRYYGYSRRARGPELPKVGGTLPGYDSEEQRRFPELNRQQPAGSLAPFATSPFDPSRTGTNSQSPYEISHPVEKAPPGY